jgi:hypothetical protein
MLRLLGQHLDRLQQLPDAVQRKEAGVHRNDRFRAGLQRVEREEADVRRAIDDDVVVVAPDAGHGLGQDVLPAGAPGECFRDRSQQNVGRSHVEVLANAADDVTKPGGVAAGFPHEHFVHGPHAFSFSLGVVSSLVASTVAGSAVAKASAGWQLFLGVLRGE